jgi:plastocyanin
MIKQLLAMGQRTTMRKIIILTLGVLLLAAACNRTEDQTNNTTPPPPVTTPTPNPTPTAPPATPPAASSNATINMTASGFSPATLTVKKGTTVTFVNDDSKPRQPASAPHPSHTDYPGFDPKQGIAPSDSWDFTFDRVGTWRYHDHLNPTQFGSITVTE